MITKHPERHCSVWIFPMWFCCFLPLSLRQLYTKTRSKRWSSLTKILLLALCLVLCWRRSHAISRSRLRYTFLAVDDVSFCEASSLYSRNFISTLIKLQATDWHRMTDHRQTDYHTRVPLSYKWNLYKKNVWEHVSRFVSQNIAVGDACLTERIFFLTGGAVSRWGEKYFLLFTIILCIHSEFTHTMY